MDLTRLNYIFGRQNGTHFFKFNDKEGKLIGYVLTGIHGGLLHYWFSYFDTSIMMQYPVGKWMMWKLICWAKENGLEHVYLGTCYGEKALYKVRDFNAVSFFDGEGWNPELEELKKRCKNDLNTLEMDRFKLNRINHTTIN
jgi:arginine-tRNA-protein transferase